MQWNIYSVILDLCSGAWGPQLLKRGGLHTTTREELPCPQTRESPRVPIKTPAQPLVQFSSVAQSCPALCNPMDCSTPGLPARHQLPNLAQTHVHPVGDAIQPSHPLPSPSPPAFNLPQHQGLF